jgi:hypothetical protein
MADAIHMAVSYTDGKLDHPEWLGWLIAQPAKVDQGESGFMYTRTASDMCP